jgi:hypothetical protein
MAMVVDERRAYVRLLAEVMAQQQAELEKSRAGRRG